MKNFFLWVLLMVSGLVATYLVFLGVISISVGLHHPQEAGSWMPVLVGSLCVLVVLWILFRTARFLVQALRKTDSLNV